MDTIIPWKLIITHLKGEATPAQELLLQDWLSKEDNNSLFVELEQLWKEVRAVASRNDPDVSLSWMKMESRINKQRKKKKSYGFVVRFAAAVACVLLLFAVSYTYLNTENNDTHVYSAINGKSRLVLPDGSIVWLNTGSEIYYVDNFSKKRHLNLQGEASFDVKENKNNPFIVSVEDFKIKVYGTSFNINSYPARNIITVALSKGSVSIIHKDVESFIKPGEIAIIDRLKNSITIENADVAFEMSWAKESINFEAQSLEHICKYLEKWYNVKIKVDSEIAKSQFYTFTIKNDPLEIILRIMAKINPISYSFDEDNNVEIKKLNPKNK